MKDNKNKTEYPKQGDANPDPITGAPGSHPVGTGIGAAGGAAAGAAGTVAAAAALGSAVGPVGTVVGGAIGAIVGGLAGKAVAEKIDPTVEDVYWREHHPNQAYARKDYSYDDYQGAYRTGYEGWARHAQSGRSFDQLENDFKADYERNRGTSRLAWTEARPAVHAAWDRHDARLLERYVGWDVVDRNENKIGTLECLWSNHAGDTTFIGVKTGWIFGKIHVVPASAAQVHQAHKHIWLSYDEAKVKDAPNYDSGVTLTPDMENEVRGFYGSCCAS